MPHSARQWHTRGGIVWMATSSLPRWISLGTKRGSEPINCDSSNEKATGYTSRARRHPTSTATVKWYGASSFGSEKRNRVEPLHAQERIKVHTGAFTFRL